MSIQSNTGIYYTRKITTSSVVREEYKHKSLRTDVIAASMVVGPVRYKLQFPVGTVSVVNEENRIPTE